MKINYSLYQEEIVKIRRKLHMHPETAFNEFKTTAFIKDYLENIGYDVKSVEPTGCTALLEKDKSLPYIVVRAEMDAVPIDEKTNLSFASKEKGAMHACGHDANMAVALVLAKLCANTKDMLSCNVHFIFEPAEEIGGGAEVMIKHGVLKTPKPDAFIMFHFANKESGGLEVNESIATAAIGKLDITLVGVSSHWANQTKAKNALLAASEFMVEIDKINKTFESPYPFCVGIGTLNGGSSTNIVPDYAEMHGNIRSCTMEDFYKLSDLVETVGKKISEKTGVEISVEISKDPITPIVNDKFMVQKAAEVGLVLGGAVTLVFTFIYFMLRDTLSFREFTECIPEGFKSMIAPILILTMAWTLSGMTNLLGAKVYVADLVSSSAGSMQGFLPMIIFIVAALLAFATGTSWGTFSILIPIVIGVFPSGQMMVISIASCLAGAVCGDHCSPISDTTIMASAGGHCEHVNHVSTQLPYALVVAAVCMVGYLLIGILQAAKLAALSWLALPVCIVLLFVILMLIRAKTGREEI